MTLFCRIDLRKVALPCLWYRKKEWNRQRGRGWHTKDWREREERGKRETKRDSLREKGEPLDCQTWIRPWTQGQSQLHGDVDRQNDISRYTVADGWLGNRDHTVADGWLGNRDQSGAVDVMNGTPKCITRDILSSTTLTGIFAMSTRQKLDQADFNGISLASFCLNDSYRRHVGGGVYTTCCNSQSIMNF